MKIYFEGKKQVIADVDGYSVKTDQPINGGGEGLYPTPFSLFLSSLGTCAGIFVKGFCDSRGISTEKVYLTQEQFYNAQRGIIDDIHIQIHVPEDFPKKYESAVINAASLCAVKRHLIEDIKVNVEIIRE